MKEPSAASSSPVGYLAAFTLGIICMGVIMFFTSRNGDRMPHGRDLIQPPPATSGMDGIDSQRPRLALRTMPRGGSSGATFRAPPALPPAAEFTTAPETAAEQETFDRTQPPLFVSQPVTVVADRQVDARA